MNKKFDLLIIGGGAAGFFTAINTAVKNPGFKIAIIEKNREVLQKVKVSGGGRCNVTHSCFEVKKLLENYPRGNFFLQEPFQNFNPRHTISWFRERGVKIKTEQDGRMFPDTDSSQTIIDCFIAEVKRLKIEVITQKRVEKFSQQNDLWRLDMQDNESLFARNLAITSGSDKRIWDSLAELNLDIVPPVPSLFTFNIPQHPVTALPGISFPHMAVQLQDSTLQSEGPGLITHWGLSGPAILKLSAKAAIELNQRDYKFKIKVNWLGKISKDKVMEELRAMINSFPKKNVNAHPPFELTQRFWKFICDQAEIKEFQKFAETGKKHIAVLAGLLTEMEFEVNGKSTFKEEFVTAGGIDLEQVDNKSFASKKHTGLYFAGEVLNIDAVTGGFNFQAAWTGGWHIAQSVV
ncbi:aminoacetone oxidase family FAD-binding enzyme [Emticicia sp. CRIBPO]|uniref:NAD(P)/FAD-dependent oxidoreductase n=1 Tax=Emticicia sp. CRIBPO TaxID=2683258 RepID=UPI0014127690|nr:NAD(P)/FAD-dependent oxidoreductase [Emticicia sp. CRIBPO]NBA84137.1 aminoacetone oxidase family FAD-binding enzyme [Emticicia sp. CRIBPO]